MQEAIDSELFAAEPFKILERNYQPGTATQITAAQSHLNPIEKQLLHKLSAKYMAVFDGKLGHYKNQTINLQLIPGATPYSQR